MTQKAACTVELWSHLVSTLLIEEKHSGFVIHFYRFEHRSEGIGSLYNFGGVTEKKNSLWEPRCRLICSLSKGKWMLITCNNGKRCHRSHRRSMLNHLIAGFDFILSVSHSQPRTIIPCILSYRLWRFPSIHSNTTPTVRQLPAQSSRIHDFNFIQSSSSRSTKDWSSGEICGLKVRVCMTFTQSPIHYITKWHKYIVLMKAASCNKVEMLKH